ncbi:subtilisin-like protease [Epichloe bromicola]|uniref:Subtilisin-like protease n=1 Tax=Epichloe bromicola TaxID=79588 RepID=A0ABQ0CG04_9HYPO
MVSFRRLATLLVAALLPLGHASPLPETRAASVVEGKYIVTLKDDISAAALGGHMNWVRDVHENSLGRRQLSFAGVEKTFGVGNFNAYAGHFDADTLERIRNSPEVADVEQQQLYYLSRLATQKNSTYGPATISHRRPGATEYVYDESAGEGSTVYVLDSGIDIDHEEFQGRARLGHNAVKNAPARDVDGHGTHVAGTVGSRTYGVAKRAKLVDVKLFHDGASTTEVLLDGIEWAIKDIIAKKIQNRAILNMSFGGGKSAAQNKLIKTAYDAGILCVIAAGNEATDAEDRSPASSPDGITVAAIDDKWRLWQYSNYGSGVHILAPGVNVLSTYIGSKTATREDSGTSMAAPHVAGLAAYLAVVENINTVKELKARILALGTNGTATSVNQGTVNLVAYNGNK